MENSATPGDRYELSRLKSLAAESGKVMLFIDGEVPQHDIAAGYFIIHEYLKIFVRNGYKVVYWPYNRLRPEPYSSELEQVGIEVVHGDIPFEEFIRRIGRHIDVTIVCRPEIADAYLPSITRYTRGGIAYLAHDLHFLRLRRLAEVTSSPDDLEAAREMMETELDVMSRTDVALFFSSAEVATVEREESKIRAAVIPWIQGLNDSGDRSFRERSGIVYLGGFLHTPNADAVEWFHDDIFPRIKDKLPDAQASIVGSNVPAGIASLDSRDFKVLGYVEDLGDVLNQARVFVAPLRFGAGIKGKITMALSYGLPVVTTGVGAEGMGLVDGETALVADDPELFAAKVASLHSDEELWQKLSRQSRQHIETDFSPEAAEREVMRILDGLGKGSKGKAIMRSILSRFSSQVFTP